MTLVSCSICSRYSLPRRRQLFRCWARDIMRDSSGSSDALTSYTSATHDPAISAYLARHASGDAETDSASTRPIRPTLWTPSYPFSSALSATLFRARHMSGAAPSASFRSAAGTFSATALSCSELKAVHRTSACTFDPTLSPSASSSSPNSAPPYSSKASPMSNSSSSMFAATCAISSDLFWTALTVRATALSRPSRIVLNINWYWMSV
mmetsp:Transcript_7928/g.20340  ORF Transcript_7928/g.20340 Transcript_7928/m.20340 type:complete len:209 (+) Transcript_7928:1158-1784(+)